MRHLNVEDRQMASCCSLLYNNPIRLSNQIAGGSQSHFQLANLSSKAAKDLMMVFLVIQGAKGVSTLVIKPFPLRNIIAKSKQFN